MNTNKIFTFTAIGILLTSCKPEIDTPEYSFGEMDPSIMVSVGNASAQGYMDDALYHDGQENSYPAILTEQFSRVNTVTFNQALVSSSSVGTNLEGEARLILGNKTDCKGVSSLSPVRISVSGDNSILNSNVFMSTSRPQNFGMVNLKVTDLTQNGLGNPANGPGNFNPYYYRIASNPASSNVLDDASAVNATFFTLSIGEADVMAYAASGGTSSSMLPAYGATGVGFDGTIENAIIGLTTNGAKGAVASIPDVTKFPFFNTIPYDGLTLDSDQAATLNSVYGPMGTGISFQAGSNPFAIEDKNEPFEVRLIKEGELILLSVPLDSIKCYGMGSIVPIPDEYVLTLEEIDSIQTSIDQYNTIIQNLAANYNLAYVNLKQLFDAISNSVTYNGFDINAEFVSGGAFSLDGKHPSPRGNALIANEFIQSINAKYNAKIPQCDPGDYRSVEFP